MQQFFLAIFFLINSATWAQHKGAEQQGFCGAKINSKAAIQRILKENLEFFRLQDNDTIADIGAASGWMEGALSVASPARHIDFYLVDIDTGCLNQRMIGNMRQHYEAIKGEALTHRFIPVHNTSDSLYLPHGFFPKVWLINTLHEVSEPDKMVAAIARILRIGGEVIVLEIPRVGNGHKHKGCNKPLLSRDEIQQLFKAAGLQYAEERLVQRGKKFDLLYQRFLKLD
jgi:ubiquinone/menaquinone biosynthesis C-methylase UbiE